MHNQPRVSSTQCSFHRHGNPAKTLTTHRENGRRIGQLGLPWRAVSTIETSFLTALEAGSPRSGCPWGGCLLPLSSHGRSSVSVCALILFFQSTSHIGLGPPPMTSLNPKHLFRDPLSNQSHSALLGLRTPTCKSGEGGGHGSARNSEQTRRAGQNHCRSSSGAHAPHH